MFCVGYEIYTWKPMRGSRNFRQGGGGGGPGQSDKKKLLRFFFFFFFFSPQLILQV